MAYERKISLLLHSTQQNYIDMTRYLLSLIVFMAAAMFMPQKANASAAPMIELLEQADMQKVVITTSESTIHVSGGTGLTLLVYNIAGGAPVMKVKVDGPDKRYELTHPKGIYIVQVGKVVRKIVIK